MTAGLTKLLVYSIESGQWRDFYLECLSKVTAGLAKFLVYSTEPVQWRNFYLRVLRKRVV